MKDFRNQLNEIFHSHNLDIVILMETRINCKKADSVMTSLNFNFIIISSEGFLGGIRLLFKDSTLFSFNTTSIDKRFIHYQITDNIKRVSWLATFLYNYTHYSPQKELWTQVLIFQVSHLTLGFFTRDLNEIMDQDKRQSKSKGSSTIHENLKRFISIIV